MRIAGICQKHGYWKGSQCLKCIAEKSDVFYTSKDKLWEFIDFHSTGKPVEVRTKGQWKRHLKQNRLHDDLPSWKEARNLKMPDPKLDRDEIKNLIRERFKETGVYNKLYKRR